MVFKKVVKYFVLMLLIPFISLMLFEICVRAEEYPDVSYGGTLSYSTFATLGAISFSGDEDFYFTFGRNRVCLIPDTKLGERYVVSFDYKYYPTIITGSNVIRNDLTVSNTVVGKFKAVEAVGGYTGSDAYMEVLVSTSDGALRDTIKVNGLNTVSGHISVTVDAGEGSTAVSLNPHSLRQPVTVSFTSSITVPQGGFFTLYNINGFNANTVSFSNIDVQKVVGGDELLDETKKQTGILEDQKQIMEEQAETTKGIFAKITDFFDNFFSRLGDFIKGLIIPTSEELTAFLQEVNDWFSDRLGFIWYPFSLAVDLVTALAGGSADSQIIIPAFRLTVAGVEYTIWGDIPVNMDEMNIFRYVRFFTSALLAAGVVHMAIDKWDEWIGGHGTG